MKLNQRLTKSLFLLVSPVLTGLSVVSPSLAATFALSESSFLIDNYSQSPEKFVTSTDTDTFTIALPGSSVVAKADADATAIEEPPLSVNYSISEGFGSHTDYWGFAESQAKVIGEFSIKAGQPFSFDFVASLLLLTEIDNPPAEGASAAGELSMLLLDSTDKANPTVVDFFTVSGKLTTPELEDFLEFKNSKSITFTKNVLKSFGGNEESATAEFVGAYQRSFDKDIHLTLVETKKNQATVKAPEPSSTQALFLFLFLTLLGFRVKSKTEKRQLNLPHINSRF